MQKLIDDLQDFHNAADLDYDDTPNAEPSDIHSVQIALIEEELEEVKEAYAEQDPVALAKEITDLCYVAAGAYLRFGMSDEAEDLWDEVHRSNMSKQDGTRREDGKLLKGKSYRAAQIEDILQRT